MSKVGITSLKDSRDVVTLIGKLIVRFQGQRWQVETTNEMLLRRITPTLKNAPNSAAVVRSGSRRASVEGVRSKEALHFNGSKLLSD
jgi:hypothetical protein